MQSYGFFLAKCRKKKKMLRKNCAEGGGEGEERGASRYIATNRTPKGTRAEQGAKADEAKEEERENRGEGGEGNGEEGRGRAMARDKGRKTAQIKQKPPKAKICYGRLGRDNGARTHDLCNVTAAL
jgi:hypothetical protein